MLATIYAHKGKFTAAGNAGEVAVYDAAGRVLKRGLRGIPDAQAWCDRHAARLPDPGPRHALPEPPVRRDPVTGY